MKPWITRRGEFWVVNVPPESLMPGELSRLVYVPTFREACEEARRYMRLRRARRWSIEEAMA